MSEQLRITGKVIKVLPETSGTGKKGDWVKKEFIVETNDQYPKKVCFQAWNDKTEFIPDVNTEVTVSFNPESREYNGKWYTDLRAWDIKTADPVKKTEKKEEKKPPVKTGMGLDNTESDDDLPF